MTALADYLPRVRNFNVAVMEEKGNVVFLHKIVPGGVDRSYGIHVAQLAGVPGKVLKRASEILLDLERDGRAPKVSGKSAGPAAQLPLFAGESVVEGKLKELDIDSMTPLEALNTLYELKRGAGG